MRSVKKVLSKISQNSQENTCTRISFLIKFQVSVCNFIEKGTLAQMFSCKFFEIFKNTFFHRTSPKELFPPSTTPLYLQFSYRDHPLREKFASWELFWSVFSRIRTEYGEIRNISLYIPVSLIYGKIWTGITVNTHTFYAVNKWEFLVFS